MCENITQFPELFVPLDKKHRIFRSRDDAAPSHPPLFLAATKTGPDDWTPKAPMRPSGTSRQAIQAEVLERLAPAHVVVNQDGEVVHYSAKTGKYLEAPLGAPTRQLLAVARRGLRLDLMTTLKEAIQSRQKRTREHVRVEGDDGRVQLVTLSVEPMFDAGRETPLLIVSFEDEGELSTGKQAEAGSPSDPSVQLERELREMRERLSIADRGIRGGGRRAEIVE